MTTATRYKGRTPPALEYSMLRTFDISSAPPRGRMYSYNTTFRPDYNRILSSVNICDFVDNQGVREVWLWTQHYHGIEPAESNLSSSFGDISNSERDPNDMPRCKHAYTLYNYNYERDVAEALHDHGHQLEAIFDAAGAFNRNASEASFWKTFVGRDTSGKLSTSQVHRCGWTHYPPNAAKDYDYRSAATVLSDCDDWNPEGGGQTTQVNCSTWNQTYYGDPTCRDDGGLAFYVWWMQRIPGYGNTVRAGNCRMRNWWEFVANMDGVFGSKQYFCLPPSTQPAT